MNDWLHATPSALRGKRAFRLGLAANYGIDEDGVRAAIDRGVNVFLWTTGNKGMRAPVKAAMGTRRDEMSVIGFAKIGWFGWGVRSGAEKLLRELGTDHLDVYLLGWLGTGSAWTEATQKELLHLRESGKVRSIGVSIHDRPRAGTLAADSPLDLLMLRYNAAHPGAERDVFPHVKDHAPSVLAYTATAWRKLLKRPSGWDGPVMSAGDCYRFQLSSPHVDLALTGPKNRAELEDNLAAVEKGPLSEDEAKWMREFGRKVHG
ncbi:aldo/keto reductase [Polyangium sorediatum]|uniref:Aldo/keto reductase n=1 Tax=Polyangium sorediatum TaxID=889274 RepID=A0ABT6P569_9BACT|nr:aldo/keto reductase [Polyangium sorediatum]MDI1435676.1 aldo/keto reductase [Polyangium sorediatum]